HPRESLKILGVLKRACFSIATDEADKMIEGFWKEMSFFLRDDLIGVKLRFVIAAIKPDRIATILGVLTHMSWHRLRKVCVNTLIAIPKIPTKKTPAPHCCRSRIQRRTPPAMIGRYPSSSDDPVGDRTSIARGYHL